MQAILKYTFYVRQKVVYFLNVYNKNETYEYMWNVRARVSMLRSTFAGQDSPVERTSYFIIIDR